MYKIMGANRDVQLTPNITPKLPSPKAAAAKVIKVEASADELALLKHFVKAGSSTIEEFLSEFLSWFSIPRSALSSIDADAIK